MQKWEYKLILRRREIKSRERDDDPRGMRRATNWLEWREDGKPLPDRIDMAAKLTQLGDQGWELVSVVPRSGMAGYSDIGYAGEIPDVAGFTNEELWVFKRPNTGS